MVPEYNGSACHSFGNISERWREPWVHLGKPATSLGVPKTILGTSCIAGEKSGSPGNKSGSTSDISRAVWENQHLVWKWCWCSWISKLILIIEQFITLMYSVCILITVSMYLYHYPSTLSISGLAAGSAEKQFEVCMKMTMTWTQRYTLRPGPSKFKVHLEAIIECVWKYTVMPWSSELRDALRDCDGASFKMHLEAVNVRTERLYRSESGDTLWGCDQASIWKSTWRQWLSGMGHTQLEAALMQT